MSFEIDGFFSPDIDQFRDAVRTGKTTKPWFDYAYDLNRIGFDLLRDAKTPKNDNQRFTRSLCARISRFRQRLSWPSAG